MASSADFATFIQNLLGGHLVGRGSLAAMRDSRLGLDKGERIGHSGDDIGAMIEVWHFPANNSTFVLLMNAGENGNVGSLFRQLWDEALTAGLSDL